MPSLVTMGNCDAICCSASMAAWRQLSLRDRRAIKCTLSTKRGTGSAISLLEVPRTYRVQLPAGRVLRQVHQGVRCRISRPAIGVPNARCPSSARSAHTTRGEIACRFGRCRFGWASWTFGVSRLNGICLVQPLGRPRPRVAMMFRWISEVPPSIVFAMLRMKA